MKYATSIEPDLDFEDDDIYDLERDLAETEYRKAIIQDAEADLFWQETK